MFSEKQGHHFIHGFLDLLLGLGIQVLHGGERLVDSFNLMGGLVSAEPGVADVGVRGIDVVGRLDFGAFLKAYCESMR